jgi:pyruvate kinase
MKPLFATLILASSLLLVGCGGPEKKILGTFTGTPSVTEDAKANMRSALISGGMAEEQVNEMIKSMTDTKLSLKIEKDGTAVQTAAGSEMVTKAKWKLSEDGTTVTITPDGNDKQEITFAVSEDFNTLTASETPGAEGMTFVFRRD